MIETNNLYHASYFLCEGLNIHNVEKRYDEKIGSTVVFTFKGDAKQENKLQKLYNTGTALTNIRSYLTSLVTIRDIMYNLVNNSSNKNAVKKRGNKNESKYKGRRIKQAAFKN